MEKRKRYTKGVLVIAWVLCLCTACAPLRQPPDYRTTAFCAEIAWESEGLQVCAILRAEATPSEKEGTCQDFSMTFTAPAAMEGMVLSRLAGTTEIHWSNATVDGSAFEELLAYGEMVMPHGQFTILCRAESLGQSVLYGEIQGEDGKSYELYVDEESGAPRQISDGARTVEVRSFQPLP
ncbi:MAG: hypothetical protein IJX94_02770 [Clostridia bacterium]|nr:hypothetical protein [Clostridia bacterium]